MMPFRYNWWIDHVFFMGYITDRYPYLFSFPEEQNERLHEWLEDAIDTEDNTAGPRGIAVSHLRSVAALVLIDAAAHCCAWPRSGGDTETTLFRSASAVHEWMFGMAQGLSGDTPEEVKEYCSRHVATLWADHVIGAITNFMSSEPPRLRANYQPPEDADEEWLEDYAEPPVEAPRLRFNPGRAPSRQGERPNFLSAGHDPINLTYGTDPEFFLFKEDGSVIPARQLTDKGKGELDKIVEGDTWGVHYDNVMLEFDLGTGYAPKTLCMVLPDVLATAGKYVTSKTGARITAIPEATITPEVASEMTAKEMGCEPDYSIYTNQDAENPSFKIEDFGLKRYAGGHFHVGYEDSYYSKNKELIEALDLWALPYVDYLEGELRGRKKFYGDPGRFRPKPYGFEWRSPSNAWLRNKNTITSFIYLCNAVIVDILEGTFKTQKQEYLEIKNRSRISQTDPSFSAEDRKKLVTNIGNILGVKPND